MFITPLSDKFKFSEIEETFKEKTDAMIESISRAKESAIVQALKIKGFTFSSQDDLYAFAKERCTLATYESKRFLYVDIGTEKEVKICCWDDDIKISYDDGKLNVKVIFEMNDELKRNITLHE